MAPARERTLGCSHARTDPVNTPPAASLAIPRTAHATPKSSSQALTPRRRPTHESRSEARWQIASTAPVERQPSETECPGVLPSRLEQQQRARDRGGDEGLDQRTLIEGPAGQVLAV